MTEESPNHTDSPSLEEESPRTKIRPFGRKFLPHNHKVSAYITDKFAKLQCLQGNSWKFVDEETRDFYWNEFKKNYRWDPRLDADVKKTWNALVADLYKKTCVIGAGSLNLHEGWMPMCGNTGKLFGADLNGSTNQCVEKGTDVVSQPV